MGGGQEPHGRENVRNLARNRAQRAEFKAIPGFSEDYSLRDVGVSFQRLLCLNNRPILDWLC